MRDSTGEVDAWLAPWNGDAQAMWQDAQRIARQRFHSAHRRLGVSTDDIAVDGTDKYWRACQAGATPSRRLLAFHIEMAGRSRVQWDRSGGIRVPRRRGEPRDPDTVTAGDEAALEAFRRTLSERHLRAVPFPESEDGATLDPPASGDLADPAALAEEGLVWKDLAARLRRHFDAYARRNARWPDREAMALTCARVGERLALRAAEDVEFRCRYAHQPLFTIWQLLHEVERARLGNYPADAFPSKGHFGDRRWAFRLAERVRDAISVFMREAAWPVLSPPSAAGG